ncbi:hypothetical protein EPUS_06503 [Endocarpon pusillum Z07020]|uniref:Uncharacterized protein n=1 Tax=Endocarpon pusillum (strain Z07020 / HMAS-L-300199) TaxID=1263415 RepID=U1HS03_ENDPU|nr:uncharacterized protein EPUS_06503 [Endocarpon pusillum Z07020]ERF71944.1 hypothetical protein EPUS_06503 [Endocarpon pusillum Z07020]
MPTLEQRQAACTHLNVTRLFDPLESNKCQMCGRTSSFGWLYRCTQDYDSFLPESDFTCTESEASDSRLSNGVATSQLSQSILRGIKDGDYTTPQVHLLEAQKLRVRRLIAMQEERLENLPDSSQTSRSLSSSDSLPESTALATVKISEALQPRSKNICSLPATKSTAAYGGNHTPLPTGLHRTRVEPLFPNCHFKCCQSCRPAYRDRAFQSLNAILSEPVRQPPQWELENRRISDANTLKRLGTPLPRPQLRRVHQKLDKLKDLTGSQTLGSSENSETPSETEETGAKVRQRGGFRKRVKRVLSAIDQSKHLAKSSNTSRHSSKSSSRDSLVQMSRSMFLKKSSKQEKENTIVTNRALQESLVLMLAANTPLPRASEDSESLEGGEVKVEDGVAVTEEGVEMSAADIIIQV